MEVIYVNGNKFHAAINAAKSWNSPVGQMYLHLTDPLKSEGQTSVNAIPEGLKWNAYYLAGNVPFTSKDVAFAKCQNVDDSEKALGDERSMSIGDIVIISDTEAYVVDDDEIDDGWSKVPVDLIPVIRVAAKFGAAQNAFRKLRKAFNAVDKPKE